MSHQEDEPIWEGDRDAEAKEDKKRKMLKQARRNISVMTALFTLYRRKQKRTQKQHKHKQQPQLPDNAMQVDEEPAREEAKTLTDKINTPLPPVHQAPQHRPQAPPICFRAVIPGDKEAGAARV